MNKIRVLFLLSLLIMAAAQLIGINVAHAGPGGTAVVCPPGKSCPDGPGFGTWYANSPAGLRTYGGVTYATGQPLRKFVDTLPGVGAPGCTLGTPGTGTSCNENNLGNYIPIAAKSTLLGDDYYHIGLYDYTQKLHSDLPKATKLRGYRDLGPGLMG